MIPLLRAECRKLLTVRSTYIISAIAFVLIGFLAFYTEGYRGLFAHDMWLADLISNVSVTISIFVAIIAILLMGHEYRYSTITYTLTAANSRTKVLFAKMLTILGFSVLFTLVAWLLGIVAYLAGMNLSPNEGQMWVSPELTWLAVWRSAYLVLGFGMIGLLLAFLFRHLVGAIAALFIWPTVEMLLSPLLKDNSRYLPFSLLEQVQGGVVWSPTTAAFLFAAYLATLWLLAWYLFKWRDAN